MLTLKEVLADAAASPGFESVEEVGVNTSSSSGGSPLHWMATLGDVNAIRLLVSAGANLNAPDCQGNTPLHEAVAGRQAPAAQVLIEQGANVNLVNAAGQTAQDIARSDNFAPTVLLFQGA